MNESKQKTEEAEVGLKAAPRSPTPRLQNGLEWRFAVGI